MEVVPTPAARPSLRDMHSPQPHAKSTMEEDTKRHSTPDSPPPPRRHKEKVHLQACLVVLKNSDFQPLCRGTPVCRERSSGVPWKIIQFHFISLKTLEN